MPVMNRSFGRYQVEGSLRCARPLSGFKVDGIAEIAAPLATFFFPDASQASEDVRRRIKVESASELVHRVSGWSGGVRTVTRQKRTVQPRLRIVRPPYARESDAPTFLPGDLQQILGVGSKPRLKSNQRSHLRKTVSPRLPRRVRAQ